MSCLAGQNYAQIEKNLRNTSNHAPLLSPRYNKARVYGSPLHSKALERTNYRASTPTPLRRTKRVARLATPCISIVTRLDFSRLTTNPLSVLQDGILVVMTICGVKWRHEHCYLGSAVLDFTIHLNPKWPPFLVFFVYMQISPYFLVWGIIFYAKKLLSVFFPFLFFSFLNFICDAKFGQHIWRHNSSHMRWNKTLKNR